MQRWLRRLSGSLVLIILTLILFLAGTETGLRSLIFCINHWTSNLLTIGSASGSLISGTLHLGDIQYADGIDTVTIDALDLSWEPARLFQGHLHLPGVRGKDIHILLGKSNGETVLRPFIVPGHLTIDTVTAEHIAIQTEGAELASFPAGSIDQLIYQGQTLTVSSLTLTSDPLTLQMKGQLLTDTVYPLQLTVESKIHPAGFEPIDVRGTITGPLNELRVKADATTPLPMHLSGHLDQLLGKTTWQARLESPEGTLSAINRSWPDQRFTQFIVDGQGTLGDYALRLQALTGLPHLKEPGLLTVNLQGDGDHFQIGNMHLAHGQTRFSAKGSLTWNPSISWQAELSGSHLDPGLFLANWPGDCAVSLTTSGQSTANGLVGSLTLSTLQGSLRGFPLSGNGELRFEGGRYHSPNFIIKSGGSTLKASGTMGETVDLFLDLASNNLAELWPDARGAMTAQGRVTGNPDKPRMSFKLSGNNIELGDLGIQRLAMEAKGPFARDGHFDSLVRADRLRIGSAIMESSRLQLKGSPHDHFFEFDTRTKDELFASCTLRGSHRDNRWQATLDNIHVVGRHIGDWRQRQPASLVLSTNKAELRPLCLSGTTNSSICANGAWQGGTNTWQVQGTVASMPLDFLSAGMLSSYRPTGQINGEMECTGQRSRILSGTFSATSNGMGFRIPLPDGATHQVSWKKNLLRARFAEQRLQAILDSELTDNSMIRAELASSNVQLSPESLRRSPLNGSVQFRIQDLSPIALLSDQLIQLAGALHGQFTVNGTPIAPVLQGQLELLNGQAELPPLGIILSPLQLKMAGDGKGARLEAVAHSGQGFLKAESMLPWGQFFTGPHIFHITGDTFKAVHLPGFDLDITPDLTTRIVPQRIELHGTVLVPKASITSIDFNQATSPSTDMVVVDEDHPATTTLPMHLLTDLTVSAGQDVHIDTYGLRGIISGKLHLQGQPGRPLVGNGTLSVQKGSYTVYGRRLKIDLGRLLFTGGPLTNPGVELRSEKKGDKTTTGVFIDGFLERPEMHFYSSPVMEQSAIITNLLESTAIGGETRQDTGVIGKSASNIGLGAMVPYLQGIKKLTMVDEIKLETGEVYDSFSLVFGSWLTPDFYVSYGKDLVKESGSFNTRYTLGKGFSFLTETGSSHNGGDIKYEFEH